jgi:hypothetical protein
MEHRRVGDASARLLTAWVSCQNLIAKTQAVSADPNVSGGRHAGRAMRLFAAEVAGERRVCYYDKRNALVRLTVALTHHFGCQGDTAIADEDVRTGYDSPDFTLGKATKATGNLGTSAFQGDLTLGAFDDLVDALVTEAKRLGDLAERSANCV